MSNEIVFWLGSFLASSTDLKRNQSEHRFFCGFTGDELEILQLVGQATEFKKKV